MSNLREYAGEVLNIYNYFDRGIIIDTEETILYFYDNRPELGGVSEKDVVGRKLFDVFDEFSRKDNLLVKALKGISSSNVYQKIKISATREANGMSWAMPIYNKGEIIGAVLAVIYSADKHEHAGEGIKLMAATDDKRGRLFGLDDIITQSKNMEAFKQRVKKVSRTKSPVLIYGETGTGKEMVAEAIHTEKGQDGRPFISQNCAAIPNTLIESTLFGTTKGSFTGARDKGGLFEMADGGTLFLDEINHMDMLLQAKLLRAIENHEIFRVGSFAPIKVDVRIIAATNEDPAELVRKGQLREDLYYRLKVVQLNIPPLRERMEDIELLVKYFITKYNRRMGKNILNVEDSLKDRFMKHNWPGNVRELENLIQGGCNLAEDHLIREENIQWFNYVGEEDYEAFAYDETRTLKEHMDVFETAVIMDAYEKATSLTELAGALGLNVQNLRYKIKQLGLEKKLTFERNI